MSAATTTTPQPPRSDHGRLLVLDEVAERLRMPVESVRYLRQRGELQFMFRLHRRVVAYERDVDAYIASWRDRASDGPDAA